MLSGGCRTLSMFHWSFKWRTTGSSCWKVVPLTIRTSMPGSMRKTSLRVDLIRTKRSSSRTSTPRRRLIDPTFEPDHRCFCSAQTTLVFSREILSNAEEHHFQSSRRWPMIPEMLLGTSDVLYSQEPSVLLRMTGPEELHLPLAKRHLVATQRCRPSSTDKSSKKSGV